MKKNMLRVRTSDNLKAPAYPLTGPKLFNRLRGALTEAFGKEQTFSQLGELAGQARSTAQHWFQAYEHPHVIFLLCLLEQLPENKRTELMGEFCRELPILTSPRLAHDSLALTGLENLLREKVGVTVIRGGSEFQRTFLATALCHSAARSFGQNLAVAGLDAHEPRRFVPVPGIVYLREPLSSSRVQQVVAEVWPAVASSTARLILLNGIWSVLSGMRGPVVQLAKKRHVFIADATPPDPAEMESNGLTINVINVSQAKENPAWIRVSITTR